MSQISVQPDTIPAFRPGEPQTFTVRGEGLSAASTVTCAVEFKDDAAAISVPSARIECGEEGAEDELTAFMKPVKDVWQAVFVIECGVVPIAIRFFSPNEEFSPVSMTTEPATGIEEYDPSDLEEVTIEVPPPTELDLELDPINEDDEDRGRVFTAEDMANGMAPRDVGVRSSPDGTERTARPPPIPQPRPGPARPIPDPSATDVRDIDAMRAAAQAEGDEAENEVATPRGRYAAAAGSGCLATVIASIMVMGVLVMIAFSVYFVRGGRVPEIAWESALLASDEAGSGPAGDKTPSVAEVEPESEEPAAPPEPEPKPVVEEPPKAEEPMACSWWDHPELQGRPPYKKDGKFILVCDGATYLAGQSVKIGNQYRHDGLIKVDNETLEPLP